MNFQDKVVLITGAASGFGEAAVRLLDGAGARVALCDINADGLWRVASSLPDCFSEPLDVAEPAATKDFVSRVVERFGRLDTLIHFAGVIDTHGVDDTSVDDWNRVIRVNLHGSFLMVQAVVPFMRRQGGGRIVLTASDSARKGATVSGPAYAASKGGVIALTRDFAMKLGGDGIVVNAVCPGIVMTPLLTPIGLSPALLEDVRTRTPLQRLAEPEDIAEVALWLGSDGARFVNGEIVEINGGFFFD